MTIKAIFTPIQVGKHQLQHRIVLAPLTRMRATLEAVPTDLQKEYYEQRASSGGLLIAEATFISRYGGGIPNVPGIYTAEQIEGWKKVTSAVHAKNGVIFLQIVHLGRAGSKHFHVDGEQVGSASEVVISGVNYMGPPFETPKAFTVKEIASTIQDFRQAALNAIEAGFDGVEIHGANGFLIDQFIDSSVNKRTDNYGGSIPKRARFALDVLQAVVEAIGPDRVAIRFSPGANFHGMGDASPIETWSYLTSQIETLFPKLAYLHFVEARGDIMGEDSNVHDSLQAYRPLWKGPFITSGGFSRSVEHAYQIAEQTGNLVSFGRAFIANPDLPQRLLNDIPLTPYDRSTFYTHDAEGYTDYPTITK
ncbi:hypothetical protein INT47_007578 [Mucor saturninus]|uniref:NADH:flavin oxidoreductase/NADH oxidase N-terminal domain-containing protein n=1 Tax=Mucor saturninus TaxID=64648 RepID=A0A8H7R9H1_9FUNG|nr:hypothetical protein INT47_007578 [Mucor saturninus]